MSLSEQTERVAGAGKNTLKTILQRLGVTVGSESIAQYPNLATQISSKLLPNNLLSDVTAAKYGLPAGSVPNAAFDAIAALVKPTSGKLPLIKTGTYTGNNQNTLTFNLGFYFDAIFIFRCYGVSPLEGSLAGFVFYNGEPRDDAPRAGAQGDNSGFLWYYTGTGINAGYTAYPLCYFDATITDWTGWKVTNKNTTAVKLVSQGAAAFSNVNVINTNGVKYAYVALGTNTPHA